MNGPALRKSSLMYGLVLVFLLGGCVERRLFLRSEPAGASTIVNGKYAGMTPTKVPFITYGEYEIIMSAPGHRRLRETVAVDPPWWEWIPLDFFVENVWPFTVTDEHEITLELTPLADSDYAGVDRREKALRKRMEADEGN